MARFIISVTGHRKSDDEYGSQIQIIENENGTIALGRAIVNYGQEFPDYSYVCHSFVRDES